MIIELIIEKKQKHLKMCTDARLPHSFTTKELANSTGNLVASNKALPYRSLLHRQLTYSNGLKKNKYEFQQHILQDQTVKSRKCNSRKKLHKMFERFSEWKLPDNRFKQIVTKSDKRDVDIFASRVNHQLPNDTSWRNNQLPKNISWRHGRAADAFYLSG